MWRTCDVLVDHSGLCVRAHHHLKVSVVHLVLLLALPPALAPSRQHRRLDLVVGVVVVIIVLVP